MFDIPTLRDLAQRARSAFRANLKGSDAWVWPNNVYVSAKVIAGMTFEIFGFLSYVSKQMFAYTAPDIDSLLMHGAEYGIPLRPAGPASGEASITCDAALTVNTDAVLQRSDGFQYLVKSGGVLTGAGSISLPIEAAADGKLGNTVDGTPLELISGYSTTGNVVAAADGDVTLGADVEDIETYRARILFRKRNPPHGGSAADYVIWSGQVSGVTRTFVERLWNGAGTVRVFVLMDGLFTDGIPSGTAITRVYDYLDTVKPAGARLSVAAPTAHPIDIVATGVAPFTTAVQEAILAELREMFFRRGRVAGADTDHPGMPFLATPYVFSRSWIWQAIANATGEDRHVLTSPAADIPLARAEIPTLGSVSLSA